MRKTLKYAALAVAALLALLVAAAGIFAATFNPNDYKPLLIRLVQEKTQRTLAIPGDIKLSFFPKLGADLGPLRISEHKGSAEFASVRHATLSLALLPLLSRQFVVDQVRIDGLRATIRRNKDGSTNFDDLLARDEDAGRGAGAAGGGGGEGSGAPLRFDIDGVRLTDASVLFEDRQQARRIELSGLDLETGKIADGAASQLELSTRIKGDRPDVDAALALKTGFSFDLAAKAYRFKGLGADVKGRLAGFSDLGLRLSGDADLKPQARRFVLDGVKLAVDGKRSAETIKGRLEIPKLALTDATVSGGKLSGEVAAAGGARDVRASFSAPAFEGSPQAFRIPALALDIALRQDRLDAKANVSGAVSGDIDKLLFTSPQLTLKLSGKQGDTALGGSLVTPVSANLQQQQVELSRIAADLNLPNPGGGMLKLKADGQARVDLGKKTASARLDGRLDQSVFNARLGLNGFAPPLYTFDVGIDQLDLDRYRAKAAPGAATPAPQAAQGATAQRPPDFSALQKLHANGSMRIGALKAANVRSSNVRVDVRAANGRLDASPIAAGLYGGSASGALTITAGNPARFALRQTLSGIDVGPLLKDAIGKDPVSGKGNVQLDVTTRGMSFDQIRKALNGSARLELRDGAVRGINIAQAVRDAKARLGQLRGDEKAQAGTAAGAEKTDFSELTGSFRITDGVARNDDLSIKSPLIRVAGAGDINLGAERLDYLARTTVVSTLQGQGGPELQALKGLTVPVRLSGPFSAIGWQVDFAGMATELAKRKLDERKDEVREKAQKALEEQKEKVRSQLQEQLKGLFGK
ncbi:MAG TPA: AsmA family protein [Noviherbaspirillum sp.]|uniref:AsmA family protein n=1 Tax=Noviherbaspirillum sp. TaxID=1926288 RepID=UPI002D600E72|nr:AsmA family protein [Noviherbaspirillum sp.]HYD96329.1 AsmA family protein [Noviherbaspirillum sp.]